MSNFPLLYITRINMITSYQTFLNKNDSVLFPQRLSEYQNGIYMNFYCSIF
jgi:hypothetical protein